MTGVEAIGSTRVCETKDDGDSVRAVRCGSARVDLSLMASVDTAVGAAVAIKFVLFCILRLRLCLCSLMPE